MKRAALATVTLCLIAAGVALLGAALAWPPGGLPRSVVVVVLYNVPIALTFSAVGLAILRRSPGHPVGWSLGLLGAATAVGTFTEGYAAWELAGLDWLLWGWTLLDSLFAAFAAALLLFPTGTLPGPRWRWLGRALVVYVIASTLVSAFAPWPRRDGFSVLFVMEWRGWPSTQPLGWSGPPWLADLAQGISPVGVVLVLLAAASLIPRWRRSRGEQRQQLKWLTLTVLVMALELTFGLTQSLLGNESTDAMSDLVGVAVFGLVIASVPVAMGLAIVRYRLYDIDTIISRTLAFGGMAMVLVTAYLVAVVLGGQMAGHFGELVSRTTWLSADSSTLLALAVTGTAALTFDLVRQRLQAMADRLVFGARAVPYELLSRFGARLSTAVAPSEVLAVIAEAAARAARGRAAMVTASLADGDTLTASWPIPSSTFDLTVPMGDGDQVLGEIHVKASGMLPADSALLRDVAAVATSALRNLRLDAELTSLRNDIDRRSVEVVASRRRLEDAERTERLRLAQVVAARIGPDIEALRVALARAGPRPSPADFESLGERAAHLADEVRALSRGIRPAVLTDHGLVAALRARLRRLEAHATLDVDESLVHVRLPGPIETTLYMVCSEAIAGSTGAVSLRLWRPDGRLAFEVSHAGADPIPVPTIAADRLAALGGELQSADVHTLGGWLPLVRMPPAGRGALAAS